MASNNENKQPDRVAIVTGANTGIGKVTALELARKGYHVILACRSENKTTPVIEEIKKQTGNNNVEFLQLDLGSLKSVRAAAQGFLARGLPLQLLVNNAGLINGDGNTADGFQLVFGTNHLGPFLFTMLLLPRLKESKPSRIVHVSSEAHYTKQKPNWDEIKNPPATGYMGQWAHYEFSKLCNVAFSNDLAKKLAGTGVTSNSLHPGRVNTDVSRNIPGFIRWIIKPFFLSPEDGAKCSLFVATDPSLNEVSGKYFDNSKVQAEHPNANDPAFVKDLWERSAEWTGLTADELAAAGL